MAGNQPEMNEVAEPFGRFRRSICLTGRHKKGTLPKKRLTQGWHFGEVKKDYKHFHNSTLRVEQSQLYRSSSRHLIANLIQI